MGQQLPKAAVDQVAKANIETSMKYCPSSEAFVEAEIVSPLSCFLLYQRLSSKNESISAAYTILSYFFFPFACPSLSTWDIRIVCPEKAPHSYPVIPQHAFFFGGGICLTRGHSVFDGPHQDGPDFISSILLEGFHG